jgi:hypothetical protein
MCGGRVMDLVAAGVVEAQDLECLEIAPAFIKKLEPVVDDAFDCCTQVQLVPQGIELDAEVNVLQQKGCLVDVERMGLLVRCHIAVNDGVG